MTDKLPPLSTQIAPPSQPPVVPLPNGTPVTPSLPKTEAAEEEEPYTIKCICDFTGDDGNTIFCETCECWQHIECYYPDSMDNALREDFSHSCIDCKPRPLDKQKAIQRQRQRLEVAAANNKNKNSNNNTGSATNNSKITIAEEQTIDKKPKRPPTKSHKKKVKPPPVDTETNGGHMPSGHDHVKHALSHPDHGNGPPTKKSKTSHKASHSISSQTPKRSPSFVAARSGHAIGHPPSPVTTPPDVPIEFEMYTPTAGFVAAYSEHHVNPVTSNSFAALNVSVTLAIWPRDAARMKTDAGCEPKDVFRPMPSKAPCYQLQLENKIVEVAGDSVVHLRHLTTPVAIPKEEPLIELNGSIDFQKAYCARPENRWDQLTFPLPFVFFHDTLPLCIDTREEGSIARYVRRSCRPTSRLETSLDPSNTALYHFMLIADRDIKPKEQITIPWDFRLPTEIRSRWTKLLGLDLDEEDTGKPAEPQSEQDLIQLRDFIASLLGEYGGCACELGQDCAFPRFLRKFNGKAHVPSRPVPHPKKRSRVKQPKVQVTVSPTSTGHATNSRAASESHADEAPEHDGRSASGSARSKPPSRDRTPAPGRHPSLDTYGILTEPTEREKRKAAAFEENIRRTEEQKPKKKKARVSDGPIASSTKLKPAKRGPTSQASSTTSATVGRHYVDAATCRSKSNSPASTLKAAKNPIEPKPPKSSSRDMKGTQTPRPISTAPRPVYVDNGTQTESAMDWYPQKQDSQPRRRVISLAKRLLQNRHKQRLDDNTREPASNDRSSPGSPVVAEPPKIDKANSPPAETPSTVVPPPPTTQTKATAPATSPSIRTGDTNMPDAPIVPSATDATPGSTTLTPTITTTSTSTSTATATTTTTTSPTTKADAPAAAAAAAAPTVIHQGPISGTAAKVKTADLRVQMPPVPAFNGPSSTISTTPLSATGSATGSVSSPFSAVNNLTSPFGTSTMNGGIHPSPQRKKLSLSDYRRSRNMAAAAAAKTASGLSNPGQAQDDAKLLPGQENVSPTGGKVNHAEISVATSNPPANTSL